MVIRLPLTATTLYTTVEPRMRTASPDWNCGPYASASGNKGRRQKTRTPMADA
jgi:hypothetical protein